MRTESEMQITLQMLEKTFDIDVSPGRELKGEELEKWLVEIEHALFNQIFNELDELDDPFTKVDYDSPSP